MFGCHVFMVNGKLCLGVEGDELLVRLPPDTHAAVAETPGVRTLSNKGLMDGYFYISPAAYATRAQWQHWIATALAFNPLPRPRARRPHARTGYQCARSKRAHHALPACAKRPKHPATRKSHRARLRASTPCSMTTPDRPGDTPCPSASFNLAARATRAQACASAPCADRRAVCPRPNLPVATITTSGTPSCPPRPNSWPWARLRRKTGTPRTGNSLKSLSQGHGRSPGGAHAGPARGVVAPRPFRPGVLLRGRSPLPPQHFAQPAERARGRLRH